MRAIWIAVALLASGCIFRNAPEPRFFRPESVALDASPAASAASFDGPRVALRLRPVRGTPLLRERIVWRASPVEYGLYEQRRWTELPASYVERALESALRATPGIRLTDDLGSAVLRVEVIAFDEVLAPAGTAEVSLAVELADSDQHRVLDRMFTTEAPIADETPAAMAAAMGKALDRAVAAVATAVGERLRGP
jgi:ABC-type uncharacterized transport system auxiliary subunit